MIKNQISKIKYQNEGVASRRNFFIKLLIFLLLLLWLGVLYAQKVDLATADLGRHLQNGRWVMESHFNLIEKKSPVHENFYSYTYPDFPTVNHHWGSGVIFYWIFELVGFSGLSFFYIILSLLAFGIFFLIAYCESNFTLAVLTAFLLVPLMAERTEIRPEVWSVLLSAIFLLLFWKYWQGKVGWKWLFLLVPLQIVWANFHVYFFLGIFLAGCFWLSEIFWIIFQKMTDEEFTKGLKRAKILVAILVLICVASLVNPFGLEGFLYPLKIFKNYGYTIVENKSVSFVENYGVINPNFALIKAVLVLAALSLFLLLAVDRKKISIFYLLSFIFFGFLGWLAIRNFTLLGFFALPILAYNFYSVLGQKKSEANAAKESGVAVLYIILIAVGLWGNYKYVEAHQRGMGIGLESGVEGAADFVRRENIKGPIFNNYDIGGYLIWNLPEGEKVFVDNRPEAYPDSFFSQIYKPMQENPDIFEKVDREYSFKTIIFSRNDITPWWMNFLKVIQDNKNWEKVFEDDFAVIYARKGN